MGRQVFDQTPVANGVPSTERCFREIITGFVRFCQWMAARGELHICQIEGLMVYFMCDNENHSQQVVGGGESMPDKNLDDFWADAFRAAGRRLTSQRRLVLETLEASGEHLSAEALYTQARARVASISLATVYRTLAVLKEMGLVEEHRLGEDRCYYESVRNVPHYHFTCLQCGKVLEFSTPLVRQIERELSEREGVQVTCAHLRLSGYCAECLSAQAASSEAATAKCG